MHKQIFGNGRVAPTDMPCELIRRVARQRVQENASSVPKATGRRTK